MNIKITRRFYNVNIYFLPADKINLTILMIHILLSRTRNVFIYQMESNFLSLCRIQIKKTRKLERQAPYWKRRINSCYIKKEHNNSRSTKKISAFLQIRRKNIKTVYVVSQLRRENGCIHNERRNTQSNGMVMQKIDQWKSSGPLNQAIVNTFMD